MTPKQKKLVDEYLVDLNATQAAIRAGYSEKNAARIALEILHKTHVQEYLEQRQKELMARVEVSQEQVMRELAAIGFSDIADYLEADEAHGVRIKATGKIPARKRAAIASIEQSRDGVKLRLYNKLEALEQIGRRIGFFNGRSDAPVKNNLLEQIEASAGKEESAGAIPELQPEAENGVDVVGETKI